MPQGSIVSQVLFFIFINDLLDNIRSSVCLFAVECVLTSLGHWEAYWQMKFNVAKCHSMRVTRHQHHKQTFFRYSLHNQTLENVQSPNTLVSPLLITWIEISISQKSLPNQLRGFMAVVLLFVCFFVLFFVCFSFNYPILITYLFINLLF